MKKVDIENRLDLYERNNHIPIGQAEKYKFSETDRCFNNLKSNLKIIKTQINICYYKKLPQIFNSVILNCANSDSMNAGYRIDHCITQEGQIFHDSDVFAAKNLSDFYPFDFKEELLYVKNVTFHNYKSKQWDSNALRKNDIIFAASKRIKNPMEFEKIKSDLERIIESIFKVAIINGNRSIYLWPIGCGVFRNNKPEVAKLFVKIIKKNIGYFHDISMVIYEKEGNDKMFNYCFVDELHKENLTYKVD